MKKKSNIIKPTGFLAKVHVTRYDDVCSTLHCGLAPCRPAPTRITRIQADLASWASIIIAWLAQQYRGGDGPVWLGPNPLPISFFFLLFFCYFTPPCYKILYTKKTTTHCNYKI